MKNFGKIRVSVVVTVFNEESSILNLIKSLNTQSQKPYEIVIVDGGSTDKTFETLTKSQIKILKIYQKIGNRSVGRNYGVSQSHGQIIAFTDAGCQPHSDWLENLIKPFIGKSTTVVSGYYQGVTENIFQKCLIPYVLVMPDKAEKTEFYPATRSMAIRKSIFNSSGGFNESLSHNEDYAYAHKLKSMGYSFTFAKEAIVDWFPRKNLKQAAWMFTRFAIGDIQAGIVRPQLKPLAIRYLIFTYLIFLIPYFPIIIFLILLLTICYLFYAIYKNYRYVKDLHAFFLLPVIQITCDLSILFGSLVGYLSKIWT